MPKRVGSPSTRRRVATAGDRSATIRTARRQVVPRAEPAAGPRPNWRRAQGPARARCGRRCPPSGARLRVSGCRSGAAGSKAGRVPGVRPRGEGGPCRPPAPRPSADRFRPPPDDRGGFRPRFAQRDQGGRFRADDQGPRFRGPRPAADRPWERPDEGAPNGARGMPRREVRVPVRARPEQIAIARPAIVRRQAIRHGLRSIRGAVSSPVVRRASDGRSMPGARVRIGGHSIRGVRPTGRGRPMPGVRSSPAARPRTGGATGTGRRRPVGRPCPIPAGT